jgi:ATP-dependent DNA helicase RecG
MLALLRHAGSTAPDFQSRIGRFTLTFPKHSLLGPETIAWIGGLRQQGLSQAQCMALALMRDGRRVSNASLRRLGLDSREATTALSDLVSRRLVIRTGGKRYATYVLDVDPGPQANYQMRIDETPAKPASAKAIRRNRADEILALFGPDDRLTLADVMNRTGLRQAMAARYLERLMEAGRLVATAPARSRNRKYQRPSR